MENVKLWGLAPEKKFKKSRTSKIAFSHLHCIPVPTRQAGVMTRSGEKWKIVRLRGPQRCCENFHFENHWNHAKLILMNTASQIHVLAMKLPQRSRLKLASELLRSVASTTASEDLLDEAIRRDSEMDSGKVAALSESEFWSGIAVRGNPSWGMNFEH